jgi:hypothetical protein
MELLRSSVVEPDHLHCTDFKAAAENGIDDLANQFGLDSMRLDDAEGAVFVVGS